MEKPPDAPEKAKRSGPRFAQIRGDLTISIIARAGTRIAIVKDPVAHRFYELAADDLDIASLLDPHSSPPQQVKALRDALPAVFENATDRTILRRALRISAELRSCGLASGSRPAASQAGSAEGLRAIWQRRLRRVSSILFFRIRLLNPTATLNAITPLCAPAFTRGFAIAASLFFAASAAVFSAAGGFRTFDSSWFGSLAGLVALYVGIAALKFLHEAAHAVTVRHYGGNVHEVGMMLVAGLPLFYVEASDSYLFARKHERIAVAAAGIVVELLASAVLVWLWLILADGFFKQLVLNLILIASLSTLLFNGNPLMRYDGYYILADAIDMPSLRQRARMFLSGCIRSFLLGTEPPSQRRIPARDRWILSLYGILSYAYLVLVIFGIWRFLSVQLDPFGLKWLAHLLVACWAASAVIIPFSVFLGGMVTEVRASPPPPRRRAALMTAGCALGLAAILCIPLPRWVDRSCTLESEGAAIVRAEEDGFVLEVLTSEGAHVEPGQPVARMKNLNLLNEMAKAETQVGRTRTKLQSAMADGSTSTVGSLRGELASAEIRLRKLSDHAASLVLKSPIAGTVGSRQLERLVGSRLQPGGVFCLIQPERLNDFLIPLNEKEARTVKRSDPVRLRLRAFPERLYEGRVLSDPLRMPASDPQFQPTALQALPTARPTAAKTDTHFAIVRLDNDSRDLKIGMSGRVRIRCGYRTVGRALLERAMDFLRLDFRMQ